MALTVGAYVWPGQAHAVAVAAVVALNCGVRKSARLTRVIVALALAVLAAVGVVCLGSGEAEVGASGGLGVGAVVAVPAATVDVRGAIGFSSFAVQTYYAVANASAWTLDPAPVARPGRWWASSSGWCSPSRCR